VGADTLITFGEDSILLQNMQVSSLNSGDFLFF